MANIGGMELSFDDSWMEEVPGQEFARFGEYKDDQDVVARHLEEAEEAAAMAHSSSEKNTEDNHIRETAADTGSVATIEKGLALCKLDSSPGGQEANGSSMSNGGSALVFDDDWMDEVPGQECARFGTYSDDRDVGAKHEQEEADAAATLALLQQTQPNTD